MPRVKVGILGVKKDPKNQILFSFNSRGGLDDWPSDDSEDSDYDPGESSKSERNINQVKQLKRKNDSISKTSGEANPKVKKTIKEEKIIRKERRIHKINKSSTNKVHLNGDPWGSQLPPEVLLKVFGYVVDEKGAVPFLPRACRVCQLWNIAASDNILWADVDLSYGWVKKKVEKLKWLCNNRLSKVKILDLTGWADIVDDNILQMISTSCLQLEQICLQGCMKITADGLHKFAKKCNKLHGLDISHIPPSQGSGKKRLRSNITASKSLCHLVEEVGDRLKSINLSCHKITGCNAVLRNITKHCHNLTRLDMYNMDMATEVTLDIEQLQIGCPQLRVLNLNCTLFRSSQSISHLATPGFTELQELNLYRESSVFRHAPTDDILKRLLCTSTKLHLLDLRFCKLLTTSVLLDLCCTEISQLYLTGTELTRDEDIIRALSKWSHSLVELEVDRCTLYCDDFPTLLYNLGHQNSKLEVLNVASSNINMESLRELLKACNKLKTIDISSCRSLESGYKRKYATYSEIQQLRKRLEIR